jgi:hypothetical protein
MALNQGKRFMAALSRGLLVKNTNNGSGYIFQDK